MAKPKLSEKDIPRLAKMAEHGLMYKDIAAAHGVTPFTFSKWINDPRTPAQAQLAQALKDAEKKAKEAMLMAIQRAAIEDRTWQAAAWYLERKFPAEFGKSSRLEAIAAEKVKDGTITLDPLSKAIEELSNNGH